MKRVMEEGSGGNNDDNNNNNDDANNNDDNDNDNNNSNNNEREDGDEENENGDTDAASTSASTDDASSSSTPSSATADFAPPSATAVAIAASVDTTIAHLRAGNFKIIESVVSHLADGARIKSEVDDVIDRCRAMINLRECILYTREMYEKETVERRDFWRSMGRNFVERYAYLLLFHAYLKANVDTDFQRPFSKWLTTQKAALEVLGTQDEGPLSQFQWQ